MKNYLSLLAQYNLNANRQVIKILEGLSEEDRFYDRKSFAHSLHGILDHITEAGLYFQKQIKHSYTEISCLMHNCLDYKTEYGKINFQEISQIKLILNAVDTAFVELINILTEDELDSPIPVTSYHGDSNQPVAFIIIQYINHCTHHRGQISQILDEMKIENDYSGIHLSY